MHGETYAELLAEVHAAREEWDAAFQVWARRMTERLRDVTERF